MMTSLPTLAVSGPQVSYQEPEKKIHDGPDVQFFQQSLAYRDITSFILQLNRSVVPRKQSSSDSILQYDLNKLTEADLTPPILYLTQLLSTIEGLIADAPPDTGPRRFGNVSFRKWMQLVNEQIDGLLRQLMPSNLESAIIEVKAYLLGSFGSPQRLDYGTGHELSFIAFLACLWKLGYFDPSYSKDTSSLAEEYSRKDPSIQERQLVLVVFDSYLRLVRNLIVTYNLEPAGSHGVWGLDDNSFLPYMFGSAQLNQPIPATATKPPTPTPISGSLPSAPDPSIVTKSNLVDKEAVSNLYFGAIKFIYTVKRGPFWEHSPMLFDISGIKDGWGKINKGLIKMYDAEVLSKFPVVQHFPFGSILKWEKDPDAKLTMQTTHQASQPLRDPTTGGGSKNAAAMRPTPGSGTAAPWATVSGVQARPPPPGFVNGATQAPWAKLPGSTVSPSMRGPPRQLLHSQASRPRPTLGVSSQPPQYIQAQPVAVASAKKVDLASKTSETIPGEKCEEVKAES